MVTATTQGPEAVLELPLLPSPGRNTALATKETTLNKGNCIARRREFKMGGTRQPFIYEAVKDDDRFPASSFDPKAVTRSRYESKKPKKNKTKGPLISVNRHPEYVNPVAGAFQSPSTPIGC